VRYDQVARGAVLYTPAGTSISKRAPFPSSPVFSIAIDAEWSVQKRWRFLQADPEISIIKNLKAIFKEKRVDPRSAG
jgi:hypothetical protein